MGNQVKIPLFKVMFNGPHRHGLYVASDGELTSVCYQCANKRSRLYYRIRSRNKVKYHSYFTLPCSGCYRISWKVAVDELPKSVRSSMIDCRRPFNEFKGEKEQRDLYEV